MTYFITFLIVLLISFAFGYFGQRKQARYWESNWKFCKHLKESLENLLTEEQKKQYDRQIRENKIN